MNHSGQNRNRSQKTSVKHDCEHLNISNLIHSHDHIQITKTSRKHKTEKLRNKPDVKKTSWTFLKSRGDLFKSCLLFEGWRNTEPESDSRIIYGGKRSSTLTAVMSCDVIRALLASSGWQLDSSDSFQRTEFFKHLTCTVVFKITSVSLK